MCTTKVSPTARTGSPSASCSMPDASMTTWPWGSHRTAKMSAAGAAMVRWTSMRSVMGQIVSGERSAAGRFGILVVGYTDGLMRSPAETSAAQPQTLRRAIAFIHENAHRDIGVSDIAGAINVTPRSVQYTFRRHLGTTPLEYLRRGGLRRGPPAPPRARPPPPPGGGAG